MNYLIDTQIIIWFQLNDKQLKPDIYSILVDVENKIFISDISLYEIAIKKKISKLPSFLATIEDIIIVGNQDGFTFLPISHNHISAYDSIPVFENHKDPFDRLILATALSENLILVSADEKFKQYKTLIRLIEA